jgi:MscS family membrane protein
MDILDKVILDNTIRSYIIVGSIILVAVLFKKYISRYIAWLGYRLLKREWKSLNEKAFTGLVTDPLKWFLFILITLFSIDKLTFPQALTFEIYEHSTKEILARLAMAIIIVSFIWVLLRLVDFVALVLKEKNDRGYDTRDTQLITFFRDFLKIIIGIVGLLLIVKACFNQHIGNLFTGLSLVGAALALAGKESLENLIASFIIFFDKPFFTGDTVNVNNITGSIERIGLRSTRIRTKDKTLVTVPNKQMVDTVVDNWSLRTYRRAEIVLALAAKNQLTLVENFIGILKNMLETSDQPIASSSVFLKEISKDSFIITIEYFTAPFSLAEFNAVKQSVNFLVIKLIEENKIEIASDASTIVINNADKKDDH